MLFYVGLGFVLLNIFQDTYVLLEHFLTQIDYIYGIRFICFILQKNNFKKNEKPFFNTR